MCVAQGFAHDFVGGMKPDELAQYHGVVAVGGDGLFQVRMGGAARRDGVGCLCDGTNTLRARQPP